MSARRIVLSLLLCACGGASVEVPDATSEAGAGDAMDSSADGFTSNCKAPVIDLKFDQCPPPPTCGGMVVDGTYFYTAGCLVDPWAMAKQSCPSLKVSEQKGTVKGCVTFGPGGVVSRDVTATYGAQLELPQSCAFGQCAAAEMALRPHFMTASCKPGVDMGSCVCTVSTTTASIATGGYSVQGTQLVTSTNNRYDFCAQGNVLGLRWSTGPAPEPGIYQLAKQ